MTSPTGNKAFTLIEMLLVVVILGIILATSMSDYGSAYQSTALRKTTDDIAFLMRYAQAQAIDRRLVYQLTFSDAKDAYTLSRAELDDEGNPADFEEVPERIGRTAKVPAGLMVIPEKNPMLFLPDGTMEKNRITISNGKRFKTISSYEQRGRVVIFDETK